MLIDVYGLLLWENQRRAFSSDLLLAHESPPYLYQLILIDLYPQELLLEQILNCLELGSMSFQVTFLPANGLRQVFKFSQESLQVHVDLVLFPHKLLYVILQLLLDLYEGFINMMDAAKPCQVPFDLFLFLEQLQNVLGLFVQVPSHSVLLPCLRILPNFIVVFYKLRFLGFWVNVHIFQLQLVSKILEVPMDLLELELQVLS
mmetsp:Transcript_37836/g.36260  ORF Transcript_37836/g.36260 Transcript_37836/m.36260 type:complete len:203 (-) Transcript_37836:1488-2096(-)